MAWTKTFAGPEPVRVNKWLAQEGVCSRREAEALIAAGRVSIDGARVDDPGRKIANGQTLAVAEAEGEQPFTAMLNKPVGFVSAQPEHGQIPAARLISGANRAGEGAVPSPSVSLAPLGRLDQDSRGLLLLSTDGVLAKAVIGPESALDKEYEVRLEGRIAEAKLALLRHGLVIDRRVLKPARVSVLGPQLLRIILREGMKRQIRRMCEAVELRVLDLKRVRIGPLMLGGLPEGKWRPITLQERAALIAGAREA